MRKRGALSGLADCPARPDRSVRSGRAHRGDGVVDGSGIELAITGYEVVPYLGTTAEPGVRFSSLATTETISPLTNFATYSFVVEALSTRGAIPPSKKTNSVVIKLQRELGKAITRFIAAEHVVGLAAAVVMPTPSKSSTPSAMDFLDGLSSVGGTAVAATTQFEIGSNTKTFTSALLSYMITQDKISLDDRLQAFAPTGTTVTSANGEQITIADLVTDEAGLPDDPANLAGDCAAPCTPLQNYTEASMWDALTDPIGLTPGGQLAVLRFRQRSAGYGAREHL
jgi:CubicO group peptidase (beta-lactamase class C family)